MFDSVPVGLVVALVTLLVALLLVRWHMRRAESRRLAAAVGRWAAATAAADCTAEVRVIDLTAAGEPRPAAATRRP